jgi:chromate transporter
LIACNAAIYLGYTMRGWRGALSALAGAALPPSLVIMLLASGVAQLPQNAPWVQGVFTGVSGCVAGLIAATAWRMAKKVLKGIFPLLVALAACLAIILFRWNSGWLMLGAIPCGIAYTAWQMRRQMKNGGDK